MSDRIRRPKGSLSRREALMLGATACTAPLVGPRISRAEARPAPPASPLTFTKDTDVGTLKHFAGIHEGKGTVGLKLFPFQGATAPANFIVYDIPPGASEGVHVHHLDDRNNLGPYDEYYYIVSGQGAMQIDGKVVPVAAGDHVHTPLEVSHGIENTHQSEHLKVFLTFIHRSVGT